MLNWNRVWVGLVVCMVAIGGCGGGGGISAAPNAQVLNVITDWSGRGNAGQPTGVSEQIVVRKLDLLQTEVARSNINQASNGTQSVQLNLPAGQFQVHIDLYSGTNASGTITGSIDAIASLGSINVAIGSTPASVQVGPSNTNLAVGNSATFYASALGADGRYAFVTPGDFEYLPLNSNYLVVDSSTGYATANAVGAGGVRAHLKSLNLFGSTSVAVTAPTSVHKKWTVMVYLDAANDLWSYASENVQQMQRAYAGTDTNLVIQWKETNLFPGVDFDGTRRYYVDNTGPYDANGALTGSPLQVLPRSTNMGQAATLSSFVSWAATKYPADHYALIMWDHGTGWMNELSSAAKFRSICVDYDPDPVTGQHNIIESWQMGDSLAASGVHLDILSYDACLMQQIETGYQVRANADLIATSEELTPGDGYDYSVALKNFFTNPSGTPEALAHGFVDAMTHDSRYVTQSICQSVVSTSKLADVASSLGTLADALIAAMPTGPTGAYTTYIETVRSTAHRFDATYPTHAYYDIVDLMNKLETTANAPASVISAAENVKSKVTAAVLYNGLNANSPNSNGLAVDFSAATSFRNDEYANLDFAKQFHWSNWLQLAP